MAFRKRSVPDLPPANTSASFSTNYVNTVPTRCDLEMAASSNLHDRGRDLETSTSLLREQCSYESVRDERQFTFRAVLVGLAVGTIVCFSNMYFGLQSESLGELGVSGRR